MQRLQSPGDQAAFDIRPPSWNFQYREPICGWRAGQAPEQSGCSQRAGPALHSGAVHGNSLTAPGVAAVGEPAQARAGDSPPQNAGA
jgi:hypothetical protein